MSGTATNPTLSTNPLHSHKLLPPIPDALTFLKCSPGQTDLSSFSLSRTSAQTSLSPFIVLPPPTDVARTPSPRFSLSSHPFSMTETAPLEPEISMPVNKLRSQRVTFVIPEDIDPSPRKLGHGHGFGLRLEPLPVRSEDCVLEKADFSKLAQFSRGFLASLMASIEAEEEEEPDNEEEEEIDRVDSDQEFF
jgi:hypothetical protein